jgi:hypothetical protein
MTKLYIVRLYEDGTEMGGSGNQLFLDDLTIVGAKNRILRGKYFQKGKWRIYRYVDRFDEDSYMKVGEFTKFETEMRPDGTYYYGG